MLASNRLTASSLVSDCVIMRNFLSISCWAWWNSSAFSCTEIACCSAASFASRWSFSAFSSYRWLVQGVTEIASCGDILPASVGGHVGPALSREGRLGTLNQGEFGACHQENPPITRSVRDEGGSKLCRSTYDSLVSIGCVLQHCGGGNGLRGG